MKSRENDLAVAVENVLDIALSKHLDRAGEDIFTQCHLCGEWEDHHPVCPVPALLKWQTLPPGSYVQHPEKPVFVVELPQDKPRVQVIRVVQSIALEA